MNQEYFSMWEKDGYPEDEFWVAIVDGKHKTCGQIVTKKTAYEIWVDYKNNKDNK